MTHPPDTAAPITVALTGASGAQYGLRLLECLVAAQCTVFVTLSRAAHIVLATEADCAVPARPAEATRFLASRFGARAGQLRVCGDEEWTAPLASGSGAPRTMVVCPCSMATLSAIHLENMLKLARLGVVILPANPGFYHRPERVGQIVDFVVARVLDQLRIAQQLMPPWGRERG